MLIRLTDTEMRVAALVGAERRINALGNGAQRRPDQSRFNPWADSITGAFGELAAARALGLYPCLADGPCYKCDIPPYIEVRATEWPNGALVVRAKDPPERPYVLVTGKAPALTVVGWMTGTGAMRSEFLRNDANGAPAYFVPAEELYPLNGLVVKR